MWVNISDSVLSVLLVWFLIPKLGISGYAIVIIVMEGYNFILSFLRLRRKIRFSITPMKSLVLPVFVATVSALLSKSLFIFSGKDVSPLWLILKVLFAVCIFIGVQSLISLKGRKEEAKIY